ncbi:hypothetical protein [Microbulbifer sp. SAOS-129_SWC]|uniref:type II toxin-antitoxin system VapC family toxin n=1 Tax=Microbulbifer sp. SAOS-129_SWC TaxID=3145235 RepID=UPI0032169FBC
MGKNQSLDDVVVLDTNAIINIAKKNDWEKAITRLVSQYKIVIPTPALYEFELFKHKSSDAEKELLGLISKAKRHDCMSFEMGRRAGQVPNGLYIVNPSHHEWQAATNRMSKHIELNGLQSSGIKKRHMDHIIYSTARNIFATICTDNAKDFIDIAGIAEEIGWHDSAMTVKSLSDYLDNQ